MLDFRRIIRSCPGGRSVVPQALIGWVGEKQSNTPEACGVVVNCHNWENPISIPVYATVDGKYDRDQTVNYNVHANILNVQSGSVTATPQTLNIGKVSVTTKDNDHKSVCSSVNDPHMTTFDGRRYNNFLTGDFILYEHTTLPFEVHARYAKCSSSSRATCNCAVAIKSGDDVITFTGCNGGGSTGTTHGHNIFDLLFHRHHDHHHHSSSHTAPIAVALYKNGQLTPGTYIRRYGCGQKYEVLLPTGTIITIQTSTRGFINIWIKPSSVDRNKVSGLCGNYDGHSGNDVPGSDRYPNGFCNSHRPAEGIFTGVKPGTLPGITTWCSCVQSRTPYCSPGYGIFVCEKNRYDITSTIVNQALVPRPSTHRMRRQAEIENSIPDLEEDGTYTKDQAISYCEEFISNNTASKHCMAVLNSKNYTSQIESCAEDLRLTGDPGWAQDHISDIIDNCLSEVNKQQPAENDTTAPTYNATEITSNLCQLDCGNYGHCAEGVCRCDDGWSGTQCDIHKSTRPFVMETLFNGTSCDTCGCDTQQTEDCSTATIYGANFVDSSTLTCHYKFVKIEENVVTTTEMRTVVGDFINMNQISCKLPESRGGALIQVSNDGQTISESSYLHLVYDSRCFDCSITDDVMNSKCTLRDNTCLINGECHSLNEKKGSNHCKLCDPSVSTSSWTNSDTEQCLQEFAAIQVSKPDSEKGYSSELVTILAVACGFIGFILLLTLFYICKQKERMQKRKESGLYRIQDDTPEVPHHSMLTDHGEGGAIHNPAYAEEKSRL